MANILDYLAWRGDLSFAVSPFNAVDNLILAEMSYLRMDGLVPDEPENGVALGDLWTSYMERNADGDYPSNDPRPVFEAASGSERFCGVRLSGYAAETDPEKGIQFAAVTYELGDGTYYVAFRGTDNSIVGWREDFNMSFQDGTPGQLAAAAYLDRVAAATEGALRVGGHSKGGNFAMYAAAFCQEDVLRERVMEVYSNDGPGFTRRLIDTEQYRAMLPRTRLIIPESSLIGVLLTQQEEREVIRSSASGLGQHNPYSWEVSAHGFVPAEKQSATSLFMDETLDRWIDELDDAERANIVSAIFDSVEASGAKTLAELNENWLPSYGAILKAVGGMDPEHRKNALGSLKKLAKTGKDVLLSEAKKTLESLGV